MFTFSQMKNKLVKGGAIIGLANAAEQGLRFVRNMILTRILAPEVFGLMAIVFAINAFLESFTEVGIRQAIIHHEHAHKKDFLDAAWWFAALRALLLYGITFFCAPYIAEFYNNPELTGLLRFAFLAILFKGLMSVRAYVAIKEMKFKRWAFINYGGGFLGIIIALILAFYMQNVWALVIGFTAEAALRWIFSYIVCPFIPSLSIKRTEFSALFKYAKGMLGLPILTFIFMRSDVFVIGKMDSEYNLGLYSMAVSLAYIPLRFTSTVISDIAMPLFSSLQKDKTGLRNALIKITKPITYFSLPLVVVFVFYSKSILTLVYGQEYGAVYLPFAILAAMTFFRLLSVPIAGMYMAIGEPGKHRYFTIIRATLMIIFIYPSVKYFGLIGAASAGLSAMVIGFSLQLNKLRDIISLERITYYKSLLPAVLFASIVFILRLLTHSYTAETPILELIIGLSSCLFVYLLIFIYLKKTKGSLI